jgi:hypothetical protein
MPSVNTYGGAIQTLNSVAKCKADRSWLRIIDYSTRSPIKIKKMGYTKSQIAHLRKRIAEIKKGPRCSRRSSRSKPVSRSKLLASARKRYGGRSRRVKALERLTRGTSKQQRSRWRKAFNRALSRSA